MIPEVIKAEDYGIELSKAKELTSGLKVVRDERELLIKEFEDVSKLELLSENLPRFKELRLKIVKNRTQGVNKWHKTNKEFFLTGGKFVDAIRNKEIAINEGMEEKLMHAEKHFENVEKERIAKLQSKRVSLLSEYVEDAHERDYSIFEEDEFQAILLGKKNTYLKKIEEEKKIEADRIEVEKKKIAEEKRIKAENEQLKKEAIEKERIAKIESDKREKLEKERIAKADAERKIREDKAEKERAEYEAKRKAERDIQLKEIEGERLKTEKLKKELKAKADAERIANEEIEKAIQLELNKGGADKVKDLITDLNSLKTKYTFKSAKNQKMYTDVSELIDKVINHINK